MQALALDPLTSGGLLSIHPRDRRELKSENCMVYSRTTVTVDSAIRSVIRKDVIMELRKPRFNKVGNSWTLDIVVETSSVDSPDITLTLMVFPMEEPVLDLYDNGESWKLLTEEEKQERITGIVGQRMCSREEAEDLLYGEMEIRMIDAASEDYGIDLNRVRNYLLDWWKALSVMVNLAS